MPNWVKNKVRAINKNDTQKLIAMLVKKVDGRDVTNFNGVIPMPDDLRNAVAGSGDPKWEKEHKRNLAKYGFRHWYDFARAKWGTKWDTNPVDICGDVIEFDTAWSHPEGVYREIAKTIPIIVAYADEDIGNNYGIIEYHPDGEYDVEVDGEDAQIANAIWGYEYNKDDDWLSEENFDAGVSEAVNKIING